MMTFRRLFSWVARKAGLAKPPVSWKERYAVGRGTYGNPSVLNWGGPETLKIGCFCSIASDVQILLGGNHRTDWITTYPFSVWWESAKHISGHPASRGDVVIGHDVWIGQSAIILSGVNIGSGSVIGAATVVSRDVAPYSVVVGNPARVVKMRFSNADITTLLSLQWWFWDDEKLNAAMPFLLDSDIAALHSFSSRYDAYAARRDKATPLL